MKLNTDHTLRIVLDASAVYAGSGQQPLEKHLDANHASIGIEAYPAGAKIYLEKSRISASTVMLWPLVPTITVRTLGRTLTVV